MKNPSNPMPATLVAAVRYLVAVLLPLGVQRGWWGQSDVANVSALAMAVATVIYGLWKTHDRQARLSNIETFHRAVVNRVGGKDT